MRSWTSSPFCTPASLITLQAELHVPCSKMLQIASWQDKRLLHWVPRRFQFEENRPKWNLERLEQQRRRQTSVSHKKGVQQTRGFCCHCVSTLETTRQMCQADVLFLVSEQLLQNYGPKQSVTALCTSHPSYKSSTFYSLPSPHTYMFVKHFAQMETQHLCQLVIDRRLLKRDLF